MICLTAEDIYQIYTEESDEQVLVVLTAIGKKTATICKITRQLEDE